MNNWFKKSEPQSIEGVVDLKDKRFLTQSLRSLEENNFDVTMLTDQELERLYKHFVLDQPPSINRAILRHAYDDELSLRRIEKQNKIQQICVVIASICVVVQVLLVILKSLD
jgi:hypothetical protein